MQVLIIGAGGQIGSELVTAAQARGWTTWMVDYSPLEQVTGRAALETAFRRWPGLSERWLHPEGGLDATDGDQMRPIFERVRPDIVFHLAALLSATGEQKPDACWRVNVDGLRVTLAAMSRYRRTDGSAPVCVCPSSIAAFGPIPGVDVLECPGDDAPLRPTTMYGVTKVAGERLGAWYADQLPETEAVGRVDFRGLRLPGLLSAVPPGGGSSDYANMLYFAAAEGRPQVEIFVRPQTRIPFMFMPDALRAFIELAAAPADGLTRRTYNIQAISPTAAEIAAELHRQTGRAMHVDYVPDRRQAYVDNWPRRLDDSKARADWGWAPRFDLAAMTRALLAELKDAPPHAAAHAHEDPPSDR